jgi:hypothetical protein
LYDSILTYSGGQSGTFSASARFPLQVMRDPEQDPDGDAHIVIVYIIIKWIPLVSTGELKGIFQLARNGRISGIEISSVSKLMANS